MNNSELLNKNISNICEVFVFLKPHFDRLFAKFARNYNERDVVTMKKINELFSFTNGNKPEDKDMETLIDKYHDNLEEIEKELNIILLELQKSEEIDIKELEYSNSVNSKLKSFEEGKQKENLYKIYLKHVKWPKNKIWELPVIKYFVWDRKKSLMNQVKSSGLDKEFEDRSKKSSDMVEEHIKKLKRQLENKVEIYNKMAADLDSEEKHWAALKNSEFERLNNLFKGESGKVLDKEWKDQRYISKWERMKKEKLDQIENERLRLVTNIIKAQKENIDAKASLRAKLTKTEEKIGELDQRLMTMWIVSWSNSTKRRMQYKWERRAVEEAVDAINNIKLNK